MAKKKQSVAQKSPDELKVEAKELRKELSKLKMDLSKNQLKQTTQIRIKRDDLARVLTAMKEKENIKNETEKPLEKQTKKEEKK